MNKKGFTIIELIVVIAIIAILAAVVMVNVTQYINKSKQASVQASMSQINTIDAREAANSAINGNEYGGPCSFLTDINSSITKNGYSYINCEDKDSGLCSDSQWCYSACTTSLTSGDCFCRDSLGNLKHGGGSSDYGDCSSCACR